MGVNNPNVLRVMLRQNILIYWTRAEDLSLERISAIDLRAADAKATTGITLCCVVQNGVFIRREGHLNKLIPWSNIDDLDIEGEPPGYDEAQPTTIANASFTVTPASKDAGSDINTSVVVPRAVSAGSAPIAARK